MTNPDLHITRWGQQGSRIVMVHGSAQGSSVGGDAHFSAQQVLGDQGWQVLVPDRPGHGQSPSAGRPDDFELDGLWAADLLGDGGHLVGHSYGGLVALAAAAARPQAVRSLTLIEAAMQHLTLDDPRTQTFLREMGEAMQGATSLADLAVRFSKVAGIPEGIRGRRGVAEQEAVGRGLSAIKLPTPERVRELVEAVKANGIPLLTVSGGWNPGIDASSEKAAEITGGRYVRIDSPHHFPQEHAPDAFNEVFTAFLHEAERQHA
ncbi:alpha/beta fold hydrolase [Novosphingobium terrae]|uniref:alpha/beta fold hydrolase n=1 Tax=Novosphingobium terrae TaxID=2726189 RepID=UPI00197DCC1A|nr:alpha/beta hydrolase [Novosphingobium terrae]